ncbi:MoaD/ThiS family protein [Mycolicibacterium confluentis]|uniref:Molybdopterin synthase sulfur carrier subunit n=1 Tax=Mycolicibacterium confluentis TaxID=28047 RepID=A0A7I7XRB7_9MYCO|nr:MoaD/ThiS family protein [Mycolicibacterium confluentis]MCV7318634.1 MoaD/ThiS family protein [Mycolicibacterium confluentis]ORV23231.1 molybdopterin synthase sulfur carrier subunit [Mycolicibacterium confluentis]BBZ31781.1 molybdopterin synthase sulfur carrier subunit [Mycolicibacterium confluentis]
MTDTHLGVTVTVRYFAAASAAAGVEQEVLSTPPGTTVAEVVERLGARNPDLARVLQRCSYLRDGMAVRDLSSSLHSGETLDVLPPFAGG